MRSDQEYIVERIAVEDRGFFTKCWVWQLKPSSGKNATYGAAAHNGRRKLAHCLSYEAFVGPIPSGLNIDHLCRVPMCVNPHHLEAVTPRENILRGFGPSAINFRKTTCDNGHPFSPENTRVVRNGSRQCLSCITERRYRSRKPQVLPTHCRRGHEYSLENTELVPNHSGIGTWRRCKICRVANQIRYNQERRDARAATEECVWVEDAQLSRRVGSVNAAHHVLPNHDAEANT